MELIFKRHTISNYDSARQNQKKFLSASDRQQKGNPVLHFANVTNEVI